MANKYCDSCLIVAYDNVGYRERIDLLLNDEDDQVAESDIEQEKFLDQFSGMALLEDHQCDRVETDGEISCKCRDHR